MPILLPIMSRADVSELFTHSLEFKEKDCIIIFFAFPEALCLSIHQTTLITLVARINCIFFFLLSEKDIIKARYPADLHDL